MASNLATALRFIAAFNDNLKAAESMANKPKIVEEHAISSGIAIDNRIASQGMNDILEKMNASGLLHDKRYRTRILNASAVLNRGMNKFK